MRPPLGGSDGPSVVVHPQSSPRRGTSRATTWWGKAWVRSVEEAAYDERDLKRARALSRSSSVGEVMLEPGRLVASVADASGLWTAVISLPTLDAGGREALLEVIAAESGRIASMMAGDLPHSLVEHAEESGVEVLPFGSEWEASCSCDAWLDPCAHALAVLYQVAWLLDVDPFVLLHLRGLPRAEVLAHLHERTISSAARVEHDLDAADGVALDSAAEAAMRARRILALSADPDAHIDHLF